MQALSVSKLSHSSRIYLPAEMFAEFSGVLRGEYYSKAYLTLRCGSEGMMIIIDENGSGVPVTVHSSKVKGGWYIRYVTIPFVLYKIFNGKSFIPYEVRRGYLSLKVL